VRSHARAEKEFVGQKAEREIIEPIAGIEWLLRAAEYSKNVPYCTNESVDNSWRNKRVI